MPFKILIKKSVSDTLTENNVLVSSRVFNVSDNSAHIIDNQEFFLVTDSLPIGHSIESFSHLISTYGIQSINEVYGQFCGFFVAKNSNPIAFSDKCGSKSIYFRETESGLIIGSDWRDFFTEFQSWDKRGLAEMFRYRSLSHSYSVFDGCFTCPSFHYAVIDEENKLDFKQFWRVLAKEKSAAFTTRKQLKNEVAAEIRKQFHDVKDHYKTAAVLLSGGIDSFLLAVFAAETFDKVVAYTPYWSDGENPEYSNAKKFAEILGIEQKFIKVDSSTVERRLVDMIDILGAPVRNFSSLVLDCVFENIDTDHKLIIYGQAADTLFGGIDLKTAKVDSRLSSLAKLAPDFFYDLLIKLSNKFSILKRLKHIDHFHLTEKISSIHYSDTSMSLVEKWTPFSLISSERWSSYDGKQEDFLNDSSMDVRWKAQSVIMHAECGQHFKEIAASTQKYGKVFLAPFISPEMLSIASKLNDRNYFGSLFASFIPNSLYNSDLKVKPVLRELAADFCDKSLVYSKKHSFPVPHITWLKGPFSDRIERLFRKGNWLENESPNTFTIEKNHELFWTLLNISILKEKCDMEV